MSEKTVQEYLEQYNNEKRKTAKSFRETRSSGNDKFKIWMLQNGYNSKVKKTDNKPKTEVKEKPKMVTTDTQTEAKIDVKEPPKMISTEVQTSEKPNYMTWRSKYIKDNTKDGKKPTKEEIQVAWYKLANKPIPQKKEATCNPNLKSLKKGFSQLTKNGGELIVSYSKK